MYKPLIGVQKQKSKSKQQTHVQMKRNCVIRHKINIILREQNRNNLIVERTVSDHYDEC